jgi:hypothetical protein
MHSKFVALTAGLVLSVAGLAGSAVAAPSGCPEARGTCQPIGDRPGSQRPRGKTVIRPLTPKPVDSQGHVWRAGSHLMS